MVVLESFDVWLIAGGERKIQAIKVVRELTGWGLKEAKWAVDGGNVVILLGAPLNVARDAEARLAAAGAAVQVSLHA